MGSKRNRGSGVPAVVAVNVFVDPRNKRMEGDDRQKEKEKGGRPRGVTWAKRCTEMPCRGRIWKQSGRGACHLAAG